MSRVYNFSAGPSCLPEEVLKEQNETIAGYILTVLEHDLTTIVRGNEVRKKVFQTIS